MLFNQSKLITENCINGERLSFSFNTITISITDEEKKEEKLSNYMYNQLIFAVDHFTLLINETERSFVSGTKPSIGIKLISLYHYMTLVWGPLVFIST